jgi:hypothetical protein
MMAALAILRLIPLPQHVDGQDGHVEGVLGGSGVLIMGLLAASVVGTIAGAALAVAWRRPRVWFAVAAVALVAIGLGHLLPDAFRTGRDHLPDAVIAVAAVAGFVAAWTLGRFGCACGKEPSRFQGASSAAVFSVHRMIEGAALTVGGPAMAAGLVLHSMGEGLSVGATVARRHLARWVALMCVSPVIGLALGAQLGQLGVGQPFLLAIAAGVLLETARSTLMAALRETLPQEFRMTLTSAPSVRCAAPDDGGGAVPVNELLPTSRTSDVLPATPKPLRTVATGE